MNLHKIHKVAELPYFFNFIKNIFSLGGRGRKLQESLGRVIDNQCKGDVLELGSGTSQFSHHYLRNVFSYTVSDINFRYMHFSRKKKDMQNIPHVVFNARYIPLKENSMDRIFCLFTFHHLSDESVIAAFKECQRVLRSAGKMIVVDVFRPENKYDILGKFLATIDRGRWIRKREAFESLLSLNSFSLSEFSLEGSYPYHMRGFIINNSKDVDIEGA